MNSPLHSHTHTHAHTQTRNQGEAARRPTAFMPALIFTLAYAAIEFVGGVWTGSLALISDAGHMLSDGLALGLAAFAAWLARRPAGLRHSYGWGRAEVLGATFNGLLLLGIVVVIAVEAVQRLLDPRPVMAAGMLVIAFVGLLVNVAVAVMLSRGHQNLNVRAALIHVIGDLLSSVAALLAGVLIMLTGWQIVDPLLSLLIAALILITTLRLLAETLHVLMEGVPRQLDLRSVGTTLAAVEGVVRVHDLHLWTLGAEQVALSAHIEIRNIAEWPRILDAARALLHERFGVDHVTLQPEPCLPAAVAVSIWPRGTPPPRTGT